MKSESQLEDVRKSTRSAFGSWVLVAVGAFLQVILVSLLFTKHAEALVGPDVLLPPQAEWLYALAKLSAGFPGWLIWAAISMCMALPLHHEIGRRYLLRIALFGLLTTLVSLTASWLPVVAFPMPGCPNHCSEPAPHSSGDHSQWLSHLLTLELLLFAVIVASLIWTLSQTALVLLGSPREGLALELLRAFSIAFIPALLCGPAGAVLGGSITPFGLLAVSPSAATGGTAIAFCFASALAWRLSRPRPWG